MIPRPAFYAAHNCICADADTPILEFYQEYFDTVYIILHPFHKIDEHSKQRQAITWKEMLIKTGFSTINQLDIALRNWIGGLSNKWKNEADVEILINACKQNDITEPSEGEFQDDLMNEMLLALQEQGHQFLFVADEFGEERKVQFIPEMIEADDKLKFSIAAHENWYTTQNEILYTTHWDSHFTMLYSDRHTVESILSKHPFEGFYCNGATDIYWSLSASNN